MKWPKRLLMNKKKNITVRCIDYGVFKPGDTIIISSERATSCPCVNDMKKAFSDKGIDLIILPSACKIDGKISGNKVGSILPEFRMK